MCLCEYVCDRWEREAGGGGKVESVVCACMFLFSFTCTYEQRGWRTFCVNATQREKTWSYKKNLKINITLVAEIYLGPTVRKWGAGFHNVEKSRWWNTHTLKVSSGPNRLTHTHTMCSHSKACVILLCAFLDGTQRGVAGSLMEEQAACKPALLSSPGV